MGRVDWPRRILTVLVGVPVALRLLHSDTGMWCLATALCCFSIAEFASNIAPRITLSPSTPSRLHLLWLIVLSILVCGAARTGDKLLHDAVITAAIFALSCYHVVTATRIDVRSLSAVLLDVFALVYIVSGFSHAVLLRYATRYGLGFQILGLCCAWVCDSGALIAGSIMGQQKLAPVVSPGKTVVGAVAGVLSSAATVLVLFHLPQLTAPWLDADTLQGFLPLTKDVSMVEQLALGLVLGVLCIVGDLVESFLKRVADVKDSGAFFPGHGGCLDRMDSFLFVAQLLFYYSRFRFSP